MSRAGAQKLGRQNPANIQEQGGLLSAVFEHLGAVVLTAMARIRVRGRAGPPAGLVAVTMHVRAAPRPEFHAHVDEPTETRLGR